MDYLGGGGGKGYVAPPPLPTPMMLYCSKYHNAFAYLIDAMVRLTLNLPQKSTGFWFSETLTSNFVFFMLIALCLIPVNWIWRFLSQIVEEKTENYQNFFIIKFLQAHRQISSFEMVRFFSVQYILHRNSCKQSVLTLIRRREGGVSAGFVLIIYSRTSMARTPLGPWKLVRDRGSSSQWGLIIAPGQEA